MLQLSSNEATTSNSKRKQLSGPPHRMLLGNCRNNGLVALPPRTDFEQLSYTAAQWLRVLRCGTETAHVPRTRRT